MPYSTRKFITRQMLRNEPDMLFVFGDNMIEQGLGGQAKEMRGEPNAVGIPTKRLPATRQSAFFRDGDLRDARPKIEAAFLRLAFHLLKGGEVVWPADGIGTGLAELKTRSPVIWCLIENNRQILAATAGDDNRSDRIDQLETALQRIEQWSQAYPLSVFPEPDLKKARVLLEAGGITLDAISAHCMRHVVTGVGEIAREALKTSSDDTA